MKGPPVDTGRISAWQLVLLVTTIVAIQAETTGDHWLSWEVGNPLWISVLLALPLTMVGLWLYHALGLRHPGEDLVGILRHTVGPLVYPLGLVYVALFVAAALLAVRTFGTLSRLLGFMYFTPYGVFAIGLVLIAVYGAYLGIEVVARVNVAVLLFVDVPLGTLLAVFGVNHEKVGRILPIMAHGWSPVIWGMWLVLGQFGSFILLLVYRPSVHERHSVMLRASLWGVLLTAVAFAASVSALLTFGSSVQMIEWPYYSLVRSVALARFITNVDWFDVVLWVHGFLIETAVFTYAAALMLTRVFRARDPKPLVLIVGLVVLVGSFFGGRTQDLLLENRLKLDLYGLLLLGWVLPLVLLVISFLRRSPEPEG